MGDTDDRPADAEAVSRRRWLAGTAALVGSGLVAGCTGNEGTPTGVGDAEKGGSTADTPTAAPATDTATSSATPTATARETGTGTRSAVVWETFESGETLVEGCVFHVGRTTRYRKVRCASR